VESTSLNKLFQIVCPKHADFLGGCSGYKVAVASKAQPHHSFVANEVLAGANAWHTGRKTHILTVTFPIGPPGCLRWPRTQKLGCALAGDAQRPTFLLGLFGAPPSCDWQARGVRHTDRDCTYCTWWAGRGRRAPTVREAILRVVVPSELAFTVAAAFLHPPRQARW
jgi:hypothetical protein